MFQLFIWSCFRCSFFLLHLYCHFSVHRSVVTVK